jgi:hypothetical protein
VCTWDHPRLLLSRLVSGGPNTILLLMNIASLHRNISRTTVYARMNFTLILELNLCSRLHLHEHSLTNTSRLTVLTSVKQ